MADVNAVDGEKKTALMHAVFNENESLVQALIDAGADVNAVDGEKKTTLIHAVFNENESLVQTLIAAGADVNAADGERKTALIHAVLNENESLVQTLIDAGADVNVTNIAGKTALFYASSSERLVRMLIEAGSDVNVTDTDLKTPIFYALETHLIVQEMVENGNANVKSRDLNGRTPLFYAITKSLESSQYLLDSGANLHARDNFNADILSFFTDYFLLNALDGLYLSHGLQLLVRQGIPKAKIFYAIVKGVSCKILSSHSVLKPSRNALVIARCYCVSNEEKLNKLSMIETLLMQELVKSPNTKENSQVPQILDILNELSDEPNGIDSDGNNAVHYAACLPFMGIRLSNEEVMYIFHQLDRFGVSFNVRNHQNQTPILFCLRKAVLQVESHKEDCKWQSGELFLQVCQFLLEHGCSPNEATQDGDTVFHLVLKLFQQGARIFDTANGKAVLNEAVKLLQLIVHWKGLNPSTAHKRSTELNSPLHLWAALRMNSSQEYKCPILRDFTFGKASKIIYELLRECGVHLNDRNAKEETPLHLCRTWTAVELLLDAGANPNVVDVSGSPPLLAAAKNNELDPSSSSFYPDVLLHPKTFWITVLDRGLDPWAVNNSGESVFGVLIASKTFVLVETLLEVAIDRSYIMSDTVALSLLNAVCKDHSPRTHWKSNLVEKILKTRNLPATVEGGQDTPLHYCCRNIMQDQNTSYVHWTIVKLLLTSGADPGIPNEAGETCLTIADTCADLMELLKNPMNIKGVPLMVPWLSVSERYEPILAKAARQQECERAETFRYHNNPLSSGSFGLVFAGINKRDGREVAIKRMEKERMKRQEDTREIRSLTALADCDQVVLYLSFFEDQHFSYVVLELMEGNLDEYLDSPDFDVKESVKLCKDVVKGLSFLHSHKILHRDLKPSNILYKWHPNLCLKIADFGLSRDIDSTPTTGHGTIVGTRCWIAPEVLKSTMYEHSTASDMFSCGLVLHYIFSAKKHPFSPADCNHKSQLQVTSETETNVINDNKEGWDDSLSPEAANILEHLLESDPKKRPTAAQSLDHPLFWPKTKKLDLLTAVGNQPEFECPRAKRARPLTAVETDLQTSFGTIVKHGKWKDPGYLQMPVIYTEMTKQRKRYDSHSVVELVRFIRNAIAHVSESTRPTPIRKQILEDFVFLEYFPNLVIEVYKAVTTHGWDQTREEIKYTMKK